MPSSGGSTSPRCTTAYRWRSSPSSRSASVWGSVNLCHPTNLMPAEGGWRRPEHQGDDARTTCHERTGSLSVRLPTARWTRSIPGDGDSTKRTATVPQIRHNVRMPTKKAPPPIYRLKITLIGIEPPIWRVIQVPSSFKLCCLHSALQVVMGWTDSHLHQFERDGNNWGIVQLYEDENDDVVDDGSVKLSDVLHAEGDSMIYQYDFGDNWRHEVVLEKIIPVNDVVKIPICFGGARRCPPEDVGGVSGYQE